MGARRALHGPSAGAKIAVKRRKPSWDDFDENRPWDDFDVNRPGEDFDVTYPTLGTYLC